MLTQLIYRLVGPPPASSDTREERLRWIRRFYRLNVIVIAVFAVLAWATGGVFLWVVVAITALLSAGGFAFTSRSIQQERSRRASHHQRD